MHLSAFFSFASSGPEFLPVLLRTVAVAGGIFVLAAGALILFWRSLDHDPGAQAEKGTAGAQVNRAYFIRFGVLILVLLILSIVIFSVSF